MKLPEPAYQHFYYPIGSDMYGPAPCAYSREQLIQALKDYSEELAVMCDQVLYMIQPWQYVEAIRNKAKEIE